MKKSGRDTRYTLVEWTGSQQEEERLSGHILRSEGYESVDPIHPLGGPDGTKDLKCIKDGKTFVGGCYFPRGQKSFSAIKKKFVEDLKGVKKNGVDGFVFITNQEISDTQRKQLRGLANHSIDIFHLERVIDILNSPVNLGVRLEFLDIEMNKEELVSFFAKHTEFMSGFQRTLDVLTKAYDESKTEKNDDATTKYIGKESAVKESAVKPSEIINGDVYFADVGIGIEGEVSGLRPVVVVSNNVVNKFASTVTIVPVTGQLKDAKLPTHVDLGYLLNTERKSVVLAEQIRTISTNRLSDRITSLDTVLMEKVNYAIKIQMCLVEF